MKRALVVMAAVLALAGALLVTQRHGQQQLRAVPEAERAAFVRRTLANLQGACAQAAGPALTDGCRAQAELLLDFPECDDACRRVALRFTHRATR